MVEGTSFHLKTDHNPIIGALQRTADSYITCETRHLNYINFYTTDIRHISSEDKTVADALSRKEGDYITLD